MKTESEYENIATKIVNVLAGKNLPYVEAKHVLEINKKNYPVRNKYKNQFQR